MPESTESFFVQWHITNLCQQRCKHCYMVKDDSGNGELSLKDLLSTFNNIHTTINKIGQKLSISFSGGDPLLREDFFDLLEAVKEKGVSVGILGNPHLVDLDMAKRLSRVGIRSYQLSIDGNRITHNQIRSESSYEKTVRAIRNLVECGVRVHISSTISKGNMGQLDEIISLCIETGVSAFGFDFFIPNSQEEISQTLTSQEVRAFLLYYHELSKQLSGKTSLMLVRKNNLFTLLEKELGIESEFVVLSRTSKVICAGCSIGISSFAILPDGTVYPCRRLPIAVGKFPEQTMEEIFFVEGQELDILREEEKIEKCKDCELVKVCRGCRAMAYAASKDYFAPDPYCWKE